MAQTGNVEVVSKDTVRHPRIGNIALSAPPFYGVDSKELLGEGTSFFLRDARGYLLEEGV